MCNVKCLAGVVLLILIGVSGTAPASADLTFTDGFEGSTLDPFWYTREESGSITLSSAGQVHSGSQAAMFTSTYNTGQKEIWLLHDFGTSMYGRVSVWMYDTGADESSSNYMGFHLWDSSPWSDHAASISTWDFDNGPGHGGEYRAGIAGIGGDTTIDRTKAWHLFEFELGPDSATAWIDNTVVWTHSMGVSFQSLGMRLSGPTWRPAWVTYYDDFSAMVSPVPAPDAGMLGVIGLGLIGALKRQVR